MNSINPTLDQAYIDTLYKELENLDPECRNGEVRILSSDTPEIKKQKELRIKGYEDACKRFATICAARVEHIHSYYAGAPHIALSPYPDNTISESDSPMLSAIEYRRLCTQIYSQNQQKIDELVEKTYGERKKFPGAIVTENIGRGFRLVFGTKEYPKPHIIVGWDLENPHVLYIDRYGIIT